MMPRLAIFPEAPAPALILAASLLTAREEEFNGSTRQANRDCAAATRAVERMQGGMPMGSCQQAMEPVPDNEKADKS